ncbi:hypothetical protein JOQ06_029012 [Pogonophryne albipinna]|uniref:Uncharacterized protein n=1 Tax=Pogonophryne albipinna TaxID=1090488 RepID=A0AAD6FLK6_9TELE|nr:hypothetical protein JOQ06_029012 [Pogonophryne albipinna]
MSSDRAIRREEGERLAREYSVPFMETSAKTGVNVELAFTAVSKVAGSSRPPGQSADPAESPRPGHRSAPAPLHPPTAEGTESWIGTAPPSGRVFRCC